MSESVVPTISEELPTRWQALVFLIKASIFRLQRFLYDSQGRLYRLAKHPVFESAPIVAESRSLLYPSAISAEFALQAGKVQNLRIAAQHLHGLVLRAGEVFSFWAHVPRPTRNKGFAPGRELREGCVIPSIGGGLCQLTNALYDVALSAGLEIVERHAHSRRLPGSMAIAGRDATVFWNYVDLRFRALVDCQLEVIIDRLELIVRIRQLNPASNSFPVTLTSPTTLIPTMAAESCETCGMISCFRNPSATSLPQEAATAWLVDAWWPEFANFMTTHRHPNDSLLIPLDSQRWWFGSYYWNTQGFNQVQQVPEFVLRRSLQSRRLAAQGAVRQQALLKMDAELANLFSQRVPYTALHLVISQNLLPHLWRKGVLAGRSFDVFMTRLPLKILQDQLDQATVRWPESSTLNDFRAPPDLLLAEEQALAAARHWITPHQAIAALAEKRTILLDWQLPTSQSVTPGNRIVFPTSTLARKGAMELRKVAKALDLELYLHGPVLEGADFWRGVRVQRTNGDWINETAVVVLPAWVEHQPRHLLKALSTGIPVIASRACGLKDMPGLQVIEEGDIKALTAALLEFKK